MRDEVRRAEPAEHRDAAEVRDRHGVHVAVADPGDGAGAQRDLAGHHAEQVGDHGGDQEDGEVLAHGRPAQPSSMISTPSGATTSLSRSSETAPEPQHPARLAR